jgi:hypothetical protein
MRDREGLTERQRRILALAERGALGWPDRDWRSDGAPLCRPLIEAGLLIECRIPRYRGCGYYPGVQITPAGRALAKEEEEGSASQDG